MSSAQVDLADFNLKNALSLEGVFLFGHGSSLAGAKLQNEPNCYGGFSRRANDDVQSTRRKLQNEPNSVKALTQLQLSDVDDRNYKTNPNQTEP